MPPIVPKRPGVYVIRNLRDGKVYVGSAARSLRKRGHNHWHELRVGTHPNKHLQRAWDRDGEAWFKFRALELCNPEDCVAREQFWIDQLGATDPKKGYNFCPRAGSSFGTRHSKAARRKMSEIGKARCQDPTEIEKLREMGRRNWQDPEYRRKVMARLKERFKDPEYLQRHRDARKGRKQSQAEKDKRAASLRGRTRTPEERAAISAGRKGMVFSTEAKANMAAAARRRWDRARSRPLTEGA
jgi:group I intron endonuclease